MSLIKEVRGRRRYELEDDEEVCEAMEGIAEIFLQG